VVNFFIGKGGIQLKKKFLVKNVLSGEYS